MDSDFMEESLYVFSPLSIEAGARPSAFVARHSAASARRPSGSITIPTLLVLGQYREVRGIAPRGSGVNAALRSLAQRPRSTRTSHESPTFDSSVGGGPARSPSLE